MEAKKEQRAGKYILGEILGTGATGWYVLPEFLFCEFSSLVCLLDRLANIC